MRKISIGARISTLQRQAQILDRVFHDLEKVGELKVSRDVQLVRATIMARAKNIGGI